MKRTLMTILFTVAAMTLAGTSMAAEKNVIINANVVGTCAFVDETPVTINMGDLHAGSTDKSSTGTTEFWCSNGITYNITADNGRNADAGQNNMLSGANKLPYELAMDKTTGTGTGMASPETLTFTATVKGTDLNTAVVANGYTDTVVVTITP
ncbi:spore coat protein U domain-containing protein [Chitinibacter bivalviorum]|uniref:Spore coat protein U domain-containing protein n=1 Tax=Chitinibacter bivalviorum TaxID=2739434 RepID=A0A7H9BLC4_9NEIS|nr:spore coat protein U domain-containing protein [Chitinibacter bivalviorum]QLG89477.1 spore coat protein U domain-containing protein [Chitinibacter bivalviorum]